MSTTIQVRRDTAANWTGANPTLAAGEIGLETDTRKFKVGDGATAWGALGYMPASISGAIIQAGTVDTAQLKDAGVTSRKINMFWASNDVDTEETTTSTTPANLATVGPSVTMSPGAVSDQLIIHSCWASNNVAGTMAVQSVSVAGATAADVDGTLSATTVTISVCKQVVRAAVPDGSTHTCKYRVQSNTGTFSYRRLTAVAI